jgi:ATP-dependent DNA ligase
MTIPMQKCLHLKDELKKKKPKLEGEYLLRPKIDGWYVNFYYKSSIKTWFPPISSSERKIPAFEWLYVEKVLESLPKPQEDALLIAEAYIPDMLFPEMNGIFNRTVNNARCTDVFFACHDLVYINRMLPALEREANLSKFLQETSLNMFEGVQVRLVSTYNLSMWNKVFDSCLEENFEGFVAKRASSFYLPGKRNADLLKKKLEVEVDCKAVRLEKTVGDKGNFGLTLVSVRKNGLEIRTVINRHSLQDAWLADSTAIIGKIVTVKGMELYPDGNIRQPTFYCVRYDKAEDDYE